MGQAIADRFSTTYFTIPILILLCALLIVLFSSGLELIITGVDWLIKNSEAAAIAS